MPLASLSPTLDLDNDVDLSQHVEWWVEIEKLDHNRVLLENKYWLFSPDYPGRKIHKLGFNRRGATREGFEYVRDARGNKYSITHIWMGFGAPNVGPGEAKP